MKITETIMSESFEEINAWHVVKHLLITLIVGFVIDRLTLSPFQGFWFLISGIGYIAYLGFLMAKVSAEYKRDEREALEIVKHDYQSKRAQLDKIEKLINRRANELRMEANALQDIATANETLGMERQTLTKQVHLLGERLANADKEKRTIKQAFDKETQTLLTKLEIAEKEAISLKKKLASIDREEQERSFRKSVKATWSSSSKNEQVMNEKFGKGNWEQHVNR